MGNDNVIEFEPRRQAEPEAARPTLGDDRVHAGVFRISIEAEQTEPVLTIIEGDEPPFVITHSLSVEYAKQVVETLKAAIGQADSNADLPPSA